MKRFRLFKLGLFSAAIVFFSNCSDGGGKDIGTLPPLYIPSSVNDLPPQNSEEITIGLSNPLPDFKPYINEIAQVKSEGGTANFEAFNDYAPLVCGGTILKNASVTDASANFVTVSPRLKHSRYWTRINFKIIDYPADYSETKTVTYGSSRTSETSTTFSTTIGVSAEVSAGWGPVSGSISASFESTSSESQTNSVTFDQSDSYSETFSVKSIEGKTIHYSVWQLVDKFTVVDADGIGIDTSATLQNVKLREIPTLEFPNKTIIRQSVIQFDAP